MAFLQESGLYRPQLVRSERCVHLGVRCLGRIGFGVFRGLAFQPLAQTEEGSEDTLDEPSRDFEIISYERLIHHATLNIIIKNGYPFSDIWTKVV